MLNFDRLLDIITIVVWVVFITLTVTFTVRNARRHGTKAALKRLISYRLLLPVFLAVSLTILSASLVFIEPFEIGVVVSLVSPEGIRDTPFRSGLHWIIPLFEAVIRYPIYWQSYTMSGKPGEGNISSNDTIVARTSDGQEVSLDTSVIFRIDPEQVVQLHIEWQERYVDDFVRPTLRGVIRTQVAGFTVDEVNSVKRQDLETNLDDRLREIYEGKGLILNQFILRNIAFSSEYAASVEQKQVALQGAQQTIHQADQIRELAKGRADEIRTIAQAEAEATFIKAQAEAESLKLIADALAQNSDLLTFRYIDKLSPGIRVMLVPTNAPFILPLPTMDPNDQTQLPLPVPFVTPSPSLTSTNTITTTQ